MQTIAAGLRRLAAAAVMCAIAGPAIAAEDVSLAHDGLTLNGRLEMADGARLADGVVLITHGTLAHNGMEIIGALQSALAERGHNSLAITLSLGVDARTGMYDCAVAHRHRHADALDEIAAWLGWLDAEGAGPVALLGHSRGGNQTAWFAAERLSAQVSKVVLVAPATWNETAAADGYAKRFGTPLDVELEKAEALLAAGKGGEMMQTPGLLYCKDATASAESFVSYYRPDERMHTPALLDRIGAPVLVVAGSEDKVVKGLVEAVKPMAEAGTVDLVVVQGADHFFLDFFAEDAADAIDAFLAR